MLDKDQTIGLFNLLTSPVQDNVRLGLDMSRSLGTDMIPPIIYDFIDIVFDLYLRTPTWAHAKMQFREFGIRPPSIIVSFMMGIGCAKHVIIPFLKHNDYYMLDSKNYCENPFADFSEFGIMIRVQD